MSLPVLLARALRLSPRPHSPQPPSPRATTGPSSRPTRLAAQGDSWPDPLLDLRGAAVLDLGCGRGELAPGLLERGARLVHGIDRCPLRIAAAREAAGDDARLAFRVAELCGPLDLLSGEYDLVLSARLLGRLRGFALDAALDHGRRALRPGGRLCFTLPARPRGRDPLGSSPGLPEVLDALLRAGFESRPEVRRMPTADEERLALTVVG